MIQILAVVAEAERERMLVQTSDCHNDRFGRKPHTATASALVLIRQGQWFKAVAEKTGIVRATCFRLKKRTGGVRCFAGYIRSGMMALI